MWIVENRSVRRPSAGKIWCRTSNGSRWKDLFGEKGKEIDNIKAERRQKQRQNRHVCPLKNVPKYFKTDAQTTHELTATSHPPAFSNSLTLFNSVTQLQLNAEPWIQNTWPNMCTTRYRASNKRRNLKIKRCGNGHSTGPRNGIEWPSCCLRLYTKIRPKPKERSNSGPTPWARWKLHQLEKFWTRLQENFAEAPLYVYMLTLIPLFIFIHTVLPKYNQNAGFSN